MEKRKGKSFLKISVSLLIGVALGYAIRRKRNNLYFEIIVSGKALMAGDIDLLAKSFNDIKLDEVDSIFELNNRKDEFNKEDREFIYENILRMESERLSEESMKEEKATNQPVAKPKIEDKHSEETMADIGLDSGEETVYKTKSGTKYHKEDCPNLRSEIPVKLSQAKEDGLTPCSICHIKKSDNFVSNF